MNNIDWTLESEATNQLKERVEDLEKDRGMNSAIMSAFDAISKDMHTTSLRGCETCRLVTNVIGKPFGCYKLQHDRAKIKKEQELNGQS